MPEKKTKEAKNQKSEKVSWITRLRNKWNSALALFPKVRAFSRWTVRLMIVVFLLDTGYLIGIWPEWKWYATGPVMKSKFIEEYERSSYQDRSMPKLRWRPIEWQNIPDDVIKAVLAAEDSRFFRHEGIDTEAFKKAMEYNWNKKRFVYGASTISQQTVKNLFLSSSRNPLRKWHELLITFSMEQNLKKSRILTLYLNVAEFGKGIYGIEAAAQRYWGISASQLSKSQAIELAATLPAPVKHNPRTRTKFFLNHRSKIKRNMG